MLGGPRRSGVWYYFSGENAIFVDCSRAGREGRYPG